MITHTAMILFLSLLLAADERKRDASESKDEDRIQGTWKVVEVEEKGRQRFAEDIKDSKLIVKGDQMDFVRGAETVRVSFRLDPASNPKAIDLEEAKRGTLRGIYLLEDDKLTMCISFALGAEGKKRPSQFKATRENRLTLMVFQRVQP
jgi:uncharacterized protein (TIGR03067 family)